MKRSYIFLVLGCVVLFGQCRVMDYHTRHWRQGNHLVQVKKHGLLVRLRTADEKIAAYKQHQSAGKAALIENQMKGFNEELIKGLRKYYDFSTVYYYYARDADAIFKDHDYSKIMDDQLQAGVVDIIGRPGVLLTVDRKLELNRWEDAEMRGLDRLSYKFPTQRDRGIEHFFDNVVGLTVERSTREMNNHFHYLYKG